MTKRIAHLTSVHRRSDARIFEKECRSLSQAGYDVHLVVADAKGDRVEAGVTIHDVGPSGSRIARMTGASARVLRKARELGADLYHLHDPELIPFGLMLKRRGAKVVFDCHEDVPLQLLSKPYLPPILRRAVSRLYAAFERLACPRFDALVAATPTIAAKLCRMNARTVVVRNFPLVEDAARRPDAHPQAAQAKVVYVGSISESRGIREMVRALELLNGAVTLDLVGSFADEALHREMKAQPGWQWVNERGWLSRDDVASTIPQAVAGLVLIHPRPNYVDALPTKLFEYMAAGIPVISSDIELWRQIVDKSDCGICVDPFDPAAIADAIRYLCDNPAICAAFGRNGRKAVSEEYNWAGESHELLRLYDALLQPAAGAEKSA
ncbi:MAG: glycosyltransferase family 4 protein [Kiloniellaceae bacterium]